MMMVTMVVAMMMMMMVMVTMVMVMMRMMTMMVTMVITLTTTFAIVRYLFPAQKGDTPPDTSMYAITPTPLFFNVDFFNL